MKKIVNYPPVGEIEICTNRQSRGIRYSVSSSYVRITLAPPLLKSLFPLPDDKVRWILETREKIAKKKSESFLYNAESQVDTFTFTIKFASEPKLIDRFSALLKDKILLIRFPPQTDFQNDKIQTVIKNIVKHFLTIEAKRILPEKLKNLATIHNFAFSDIKISSARRRWGSCNTKKSISLSCYLLLMPENLIDMILVHELCHTEQMNHGDKFYARLRKAFPNLNDLEKERKTIERKLVGKY